MVWLKAEEIQMTILIKVEVPLEHQAVVIELVPTSDDPHALKQRTETIVEPGKIGIYHVWGEKQIFISERSLRDRIKVW